MPNAILSNPSVESLTITIFIKTPPPQNVKISQAYKSAGVSLVLHKSLEEGTQLQVHETDVLLHDDDDDV